MRSKLKKKSYEMEGFEAEGSYKVLGTDKNSTAIKLNASNIANLYYGYI